MQISNSTKLKQIVNLMPNNIELDEYGLSEFFNHFADEYYILDGQWHLLANGLDVTLENVNGILTEMGYNL